MVRSAQTAVGGGHRVWDKQVFLDHEGKQATHLQTYWQNPNAPVEVRELQQPVFIFQIYSTLPLKGDIWKVIKYFDISFSDGPPPAWEVYDVQPDVFACVDHQRREIAHRKKNSQTSELSSRLIPKLIRHPQHDQRRYGFLLLLDSDRYLNGPSQLTDPFGPLFVHFDRRFPQKATVDTHYRLEDWSSWNMRVGADPEENVVLPERLEIVVQRIQHMQGMSHDLSCMYRMSQRDDELYDYALDEDEGQPQNETETESTPSQQTLEVSLHQDLEFSLGPGDAVTITSKSVLGQPGLRYLVYAPFLDAINTNTTLESVAKSFSSSLISNLPRGLTIHLEFHNPNSTSLSTIISKHRVHLAAKPDFTIGALHTVAGKTKRVYPCERNEEYIFYSPKDRYETFAVILDKLDFINEQGVLFLMTDGGKFKTLLDEEGNMYLDLKGSNFDETVVLRSAGMEQVARRLGVRILAERKDLVPWAGGLM